MPRIWLMGGAASGGESAVRDAQRQLAGRRLRRSLTGDGVQPRSGRMAAREPTWPPRAERGVVRDFQPGGPKRSEAWRRTDGRPHSASSSVRSLVVIEGSAGRDRPDLGMPRLAKLREQLPQKLHLLAILLGALILDRHPGRVDVLEQAMPVLVSIEEHGHHGDEVGRAAVLLVEVPTVLLHLVEAC